MKFTEEMFDGLYGHDTRVFAADIANARLAEMIAEARLIQGRQIGRPNSGAMEWLWCDAGNVTLADCTHRARLIAIEELKK